MLQRNDGVARGPFCEGRQFEHGNPACVAKITRGVVHQSIQFALPFKSSMLTAEESAVYAMKRAEDADGLVLRLFNPQKRRRLHGSAL